MSEKNKQTNKQTSKDQTISDSNKILKVSFRDSSQNLILISIVQTKLQLHVRWQKSKGSSVNPLLSETKRVMRISIKWNNTVTEGGQETSQL